MYGRIRVERSKEKDKTRVKEMSRQGIGKGEQPEYLSRFY
jgi:hypothetical protein